MNTVETDVLAVAKELDPTAPVVEAAEAAAVTAVDPSPANILNDLELLQNLISEFKTRLGALHPSVINILKALF